MKRSLKKGLPGGPNEKVFSREGYRSTSPDVNNLFNFIPSGNITMKEKDGTPLKKGPLLGIDNLGNSKLMLPGANYQFPGDVVKEVPLAQKGGLPKAQKGKATQHLKATKPKPVKSPCSNPITTVINNVPEKIPFGKKLVGTDEKTLPVSGTKKCEYVKTINPIYEDIKIEPIELQKSSVRIDNVPLLPLQMHDYTLPDSIEAPQYTLDPYTDDRLRLSVTPGKYRKVTKSGRLMDGKGQRYKHTVYKPTKDLEFGRKEVTKPIAALVQKLTGYDPAYFEGYEDEEGNFVPGELDYGNATGSEMEFRGAASLRDFINQQKYKKEYEEYDKNLDTWLEQYEQSKKKQAEGQAFKKGGPFQNSNIYATNKLFAKNPLFKKRKKGKKAKGIYNPKAKYTYDDGGESGCPDGFYNDPVKGCVAIEDPSTFYENWYKNRVMPTAEGQKLLEKIRPEALERASQNVPYIYSEELNPDEAGYYDTETQQIILNKDLPEAQIEATKLHEFGHHIQAGDKFSNVLQKPHQYLVEQNIIEPKAINTGNPEWNKNLKKNFDEITDANELQERVMILRYKAGFKPNQVITVKDVEDYFKRKKEAGEALDPDIEDLRGVTKGTQGIVNLLNDMVSVPTSQDGMLYAKNGGAIEIEIDESDIDKYVKGGYVVEDISVPSLTRMDEGGEKRKKRRNKEKNVEVIDLTEQPITPENIEQVIEKPEVEVNPAQERVPLMMQFSNEFQENNPYDAYYEKAAYDYLKSKKGWNEALGINKSNLPENVAKRIQNNYYKDLEKYVIGKSKSIQKDYMGKFDKKGNWKPLMGKNNTLNPLSKRPTGHGSWDNYGDGSIQMVYPEQLFMGPGAGMLGLARRAAAKGISNLAKSSLVQGTKAALSQPIANIPGVTIGNAIASGFAADAVVNRFPKVPSQIAEGDYLGALENTLTGALDVTGANMVSPLLKGIGKGVAMTPETISNLAKFIKTEGSPKLKQFFDRPPGPLMIGLGSGSKFTREVPNPDYFLDVMKLNKYNPKQKKYFESLIQTVKNQGNKASELQFEELQRIKTGDYNYGKRGIPYEALTVQKETPVFKSEIDWVDWVKKHNKNYDAEDIQNVIKNSEEYNIIEQQTKANGTWMKNADGTPFQGTPEQFIEQQSTKFKQAYPEGTEITYRGGDKRDALKSDWGSKSNVVFTTKDEYGARAYNRTLDQPPLVLTEAPPEGISQLYMPKTSNKIVIDGNEYPIGHKYRQHGLPYIDNTGKEIYSPGSRTNYARLNVIDQVPANELEAKNLEAFKTWMLEKHPTMTERGFSGEPRMLNDWVMTDHFADFLNSPAGKDISRVEFQKIIDGTLQPIDVEVHNLNEAQQLKSMFGNSGEFDLTNPNKFKALLPYLIPTGLGVGAASQMQGQESNEGYKQGGIVAELSEKEIDNFIKQGYIIEEVSVPSLTRMQFAGEVPDSTYTPIDPNFLAENPDTYSKIVNKPEVTSERQGSDIGKLRAEFREKNPMDIFLDEKKRQFLKKNKGLNKAAGNTMEKFPEDVLQNFIKEYEYKTNNYAVKKLGKKEGWNPKRRGEWVDELTPGEKDAVAESKYGSKLQPSYWSRSLAGLQELGNEAIKLLPGEQGDVMKFNIPGLTKKEQKEIRESKLGALETLAPMDIPGAAIANFVKNTGLSTGSDYKEQANVLAGEKMANVSDTDAMALNPLTYAGLEAIPELGVNLAKGIGRGTLNLGKGLAKGIAGSEYTAGYNKLNSGLNTLGQKKALLNKKLVETAGKLPDSLIERRLAQFTDTNPRRRIIGSTKELEQKLKVDLYRLNKLKKQHPNLDFDNPALRGEMFTTKESIEKLPDILKTINQNEKSGKSLAGYVKKDFDNKIDFVRNSGNSVLKNIVDESPQYLDEVYAHLKNPKKTDEQFVNDLTIQSNTYTRFMNNSIVNDPEYLNKVRGSNIDNSGYSMDVEGIRPSDWYGEYGYKIQPTIDRAMEIFQTPLAEKWGKRIPTFQGDMKMVPGMHTGLPENVENALRIRNERINRNIVKSYEQEEMTHSIPMDYRFKNLIRQNLPEEFVQSKYYRIPKHQVFNSPNYGQTLEGFETIPLGKLQSPEIYTGYKNNEDYARFFEDTGKGFKEGGVVSELTKKEIDKLIKQGFIIEEID